LFNPWLEFVAAEQAEILFFILVNAVFICGGNESRYSGRRQGHAHAELTNELPKPMLKHPGLGKPILELILEGVIAAGIRDIFIVTGWRAEVVENHFGDGSKWNARIAFGRQVVQDGTGKAPELAKEFIGDSPFS